MAEPSPPLLLGWCERIDFPDWDLRRVRVKIDTGARTSALGVAYYDLRTDADGGLQAELVLALNRKRPKRRVTVVEPVLGMAQVRNSGGVLERRPVIETRVRIGPVTKVIRLTVANRCSMRFPVILGRRALAGDFLVDVSRTNLLRPWRSK